MPKYMRYVRLLALIGGISLLFSACKVFYPNVMFQTPKDYEFVDFDTVPAPQYLIQPGDQLQVQVMTNEAVGNVRTLVPVFQAGGMGMNMQQGQRGMSFLVRADSTVNLPELGPIKIVGYTIPEAEQYLVELYGDKYVEPFVIVRVNNRRVIVYNGGSSGSVVTLANENMTLIEVLAQVGGISSNGKAYRVKVVRGDLDDPQIDLIDLSTVEGMREAELIMQPNDIIYIDPRMNVASGFLREISPILGLITTGTTIYLLIANLSNRGNG